LTGKASHSLLSSYNSERQPIDEFTVLQAYSRFQNRVVVQQPAAPEAPDVAIELGYRYPKGAFVPEEGHQVPKELYDDPYQPTAVPGSRFPHVFLRDTTNPGNKISTIDLVKRNFLLVTIDPDSPWIQAASESPITLDVHTLNATSAPYRDLEGAVEEKCRLKVGEAILVRPDGFIAWRGLRSSQGHGEQLKAAIEAILRS
jgi:putative polyketide hydroxylase